MTRKCALASGLLTLGFTLLLSSSVLAQFDGDYAIANWAEIRDGFPPAGGGEVDTSGAPATILLQGGDDGCDEFDGPQFAGMTRAEIIQGASPGDDPCLLMFVVEITGTGTLSFEWDYETEDVDGPSYDVFGYILNGDLTQLSDDDGADIQSGTTNLSVSEGDDFGFYIDCTDCAEGPASVTISQFSAPSGTAPPPPPAVGVPVNSTYVLILLTLLLIGLGLIFIRAGR
jgi:hypothetical protein